ncbi:hypothetical protein DFH29DRAFT_880812 [Suillus ampliporus]|nr:hypothetical protein DFH29DRAFT_880812 [Suillus ampliporus]
MSGPLEGFEVLASWPLQSLAQFVLRQHSCSGQRSSGGDAADIDGLTWVEVARYSPGWNPRVGCGLDATGYGLAWVLHPGGYGYQHPKFGLPTGAHKSLVVALGTKLGHLVKGRFPLSGHVRRSFIHLSTLPQVPNSLKFFKDDEVRVYVLPIPYDPVEKYIRWKGPKTVVPS